MSSSYILDIVLILLAVTVIIHLVYNNNLVASSYSDSESFGNLFGYWSSDSNKSESSESSNNKENYKKGTARISNSDKLGSIEDEGENVIGDLHKQKIVNNIDTLSKYSVKERANEDIHSGECPVNDNVANMKRYIREYVLDGRTSCACNPNLSEPEFTRDEVDNYREDQIEFRNKLYGSSKSAIDPVDRMNEAKLNGITGTGMKISDYYDDIVGGRILNSRDRWFMTGTAIQGTKCVKPPHVNTNGPVPEAYYIDNVGNDTNTGRNFKLDNWMYDNEKSNNGGRFYDSIHGSDPLIDDRMIIHN